jgi:hypothetical protein
MKELTMPANLQSKKQIMSYADKYSYNSYKHLTDMRKIIQKQGYMTKEQLHTLVDWKSPRSKGYIARNDPKDIQEVTKTVLGIEDLIAIKKLCRLHGVQYPVASAILHFFHKEDYPIIDTRALWTLTKEKLPYDKYGSNYPLWKEYTQFCRKLAKRYKVSMRDLDKALWQYSVEKQKK